MRAGLHVLTEKLMGHSVHECKEMARVAAATRKHLATGHQRHYNILYDCAVDMIRRGALGQLHYIRAQWHRGNLPGTDSWQQPMPPEIKPDDPQAGRIREQLKQFREALVAEEKKGAKADLAAIARLKTLVDQTKAQLEDAILAEEAKKYGYEDKDFLGADGKVVYHRPAAEELIRWRLWERTGGGLMAELGSHQLDAASIFIAAAHGGKKQYPLSVVAAANRPLFPLDRETEDHVYCIFDFPAPDYAPNDPVAARRKIGVQYASINGNGFGGYGETVLCTEGTLILERELEALLFRTSDTDKKIKIGDVKDAITGKNRPGLQLSDDGDEASAAVARVAMLEAGRGYAEQIEHWAFCIRENPEVQEPEKPEERTILLPRCGPKVAMGDAVIALTTNLAARQGKRIVFKKEWFDPDSDETPEGVAPDLARYES